MERELITEENKMKIKELIKKLKEVAEQNPEGEVYIFDNNNMPICFTGFDCDDNVEVNLYVAGGDNLA